MSSTLLLKLLCTTAFSQVAQSSGDLQFLSEAHAAEQSIPDVLFIATLVIAALILLSAVANVLLVSPRKGRGLLWRGGQRSVENLYLPCQFRVDGRTDGGYLRRIALDEAEIMTQAKPEKGEAMTLDLTHLAGLQCDAIYNPKGIVDQMKSIGGSEWNTVIVRFPATERQSIGDVVEQLLPVRAPKSNLVY